jgi:hypothetical protein
VGKEAGHFLNAARYEIRSRSVYGCWPFARRPVDVSWFCLEFCLPIDSWTDLEFAEPVPWLLVCYSPREPDVYSDVGYTDAEGSWLVTDRPSDQTEVSYRVDEEASDSGEELLAAEPVRATGVARPSKSRGFGRQRVYQDPWDDAPPEVKRLSMRSGTHMLKPGPSWPKGALCAVVEAAWQNVVAQRADRMAGPKLRTTYRRKNGVWSCDEWRVDWIALKEPRGMVRKGPCDVNPVLPCYVGARKLRLWRRIPLV